MIREIISIFTAFLLLMLLLPIQGFAVDKSQVVSKENTSSKMIALTFDDGSDGKKLSEILQVLSQKKVKATFFITGQAAESHPELLKNIVAQGNQIGNHSYSHPLFTKLSSLGIKEEVEKTDAIVKNITGLSTKPFFRPPYNDINSSVLQAVSDAGFSKTILWTIDPMDWKGISANEITQRVLRNVSPGSIVLMHATAGAVNTPVALPVIISNLQAMGYKIVTISELLAGTPSKEIKDSNYTVKAGDTLWRISTNYGVTIQQIVNANNIVNPNLIFVGQVLTIPGKTDIIPDSVVPSAAKYIVKAGDTLWRISAIYGVSVQQIIVANNIVNPNLIYPNQVLKII